MEKKIAKTYTEVKLAETSFEKSYKNPLTKAFQYEYALYEAVAALFAKVECRTMCLERLRMYFRELPIKDSQEQDEKKKAPKNTREKLLESMSLMVARDVVGSITFPQMAGCAAEVSTVLKDDGTHWLVFTDGIYGFAVSLEMGSRGSVKSIRVRDFGEPESAQIKNWPKAAGRSDAAVQRPEKTA